MFVFSLILLPAVLAAQVCLTVDYFTVTVP